MANIINNNFNFYSLRLNKSEYWDFLLNKDMVKFDENREKLNLISYFNLTDNKCVEDNVVHSDLSYVWEDAYSTDYVLNNIGYTGFDNGLLFFESDKITNKDFLNLYQNSKYNIKTEDLNLNLHFVNSCRKKYKYDYEMIDNSLKLNGGFLQGFIKTECDKYEVLPTSFVDGDVLTLEFILKPSFFKNDFQIINDTHPNNKGLFFYIGVRSENKWIYLYEQKEHDIDYGEYIEDGDIDLDEYKLNGFTNMTLDFPIDSAEENELYDYIEEDIDISHYKYQTSDKTLTIGDYEEYIDVDNPFLLFNRDKDGLNVKNVKGDEVIRYVNKKNNFNDNLHLLMNNTISGYNINNINVLKNKDDAKYNIYKDLYENALGFRITDDGKIGYRYLIQNINKENQLEMVEGYSKANMVQYDEWSHIIVKILFIGNEMLFKFYVNSNLVFTSKKLPKLNLRELDEVYEKQETVPYNISLGGGTQGLMETVLPNYMLEPYIEFPLEKYFAGTFIGYIKKFKIYYDNLTYNQIRNNFLLEMNQLS